MIIVIGNGPSSLKYKNKLNHHKLYGCNKGFTDFPLHACIVRDRLAVMEINEFHRDSLCSNMYTLARYLQNRKSYNLADEWQDLPFSGKIQNNAGVVAIQLAHLENPHEDIYCIGFDSVLTGRVSKTNYDYPFRTNKQIIAESTSLSHRKKVMECVENTDANVYFVADTQHKRLFKEDAVLLNTITHTEFKKLIGSVSCTKDTENKDLEIGGVE